MIKAIGATFGDMPTGLMSHGPFALQLAASARIFPGRYEDHNQLAVLRAYLPSGLGIDIDSGRQISL